MNCDAPTSRCDSWAARIGGLAAALLAASGAFGSPALAQEIGAFAVLAGSTNPEFDAPRGFEVFGEFEAQEPWVFGLGFARLVSHRTGTAVVCNSYTPRFICNEESVSTRARLGGLRLTAQRILRRTETWRVAYGGGLTFHTLAVSSVGESGRAADMFLPRAAQPGFQLQVSFAVRPLPRVPLRLTTSLTGHFIHFTSCSDPEDVYPRYDPFCGFDRVDEIRIGASYPLPRGPGG